MRSILAVIAVAALVAMESRTRGQAPAPEFAQPVPGMQGPEFGPMAKEEGPAMPAVDPNAPPSLETVRWIGPGTTLDALEGKTVVLLVYATWCPKCNAWSGEMFAQLKEAIADKPVVVLAVNADERPTGRLDYVQQRGFIGPGIFHGVDPMMHRRLGFESNLYKYVAIGPDGQVRGRGEAGAFFPAGEAKRFALPESLARANDLGHFRILKPGLDDAVKLLLWPMEVGQTMPEGILKRAVAQLTPEQREQYNGAVDEFCQRELEAIQELYDKGVPGQIEAYDRAGALAAHFPNTEQGKMARKGLQAMNADRQFKRELAARDYYQRLAQTGDPRQHQRLLHTMAGRFKGTHYGDLAAAELDATETP